MLRLLPESNALRTPRLGSTLASIGAHAALIAGAVSVALPDTGIARVAHVRSPRVEWVPINHAEPRVDRLPRTAATPIRTSPDVLQRLVAPEVLPLGLPALDLDARALPSEALLLGHGVTDEGGAAPSWGTTGLTAGAVSDERTVDRAPRLLGDAPKPRYPDTLRGAGITGRVVLQFVVDTSGRAEAAGVEVIEAPRREFSDAVRAALPRFRFSPGEVGGRAVRTRVQLPFDFALRP